MNPANESAFEAHIAGWLVEHGGYWRVKIGNVGGEFDFDRAAGVDTADLFEFITATQRSLDHRCGVGVVSFSGFW